MGACTRSRPSICRCSSCALTAHGRAAVRRRPGPGRQGASGGSTRCTATPAAPTAGSTSTPARRSCASSPASRHPAERPARRAHPQAPVRRGRAALRRPPGARRLRPRPADRHLPAAELGLAGRPRRARRRPGRHGRQHRRAAAGAATRPAPTAAEVPGSSSTRRPAAPCGSTTSCGSRRAGSASTGSRATRATASRCMPTGSSAPTWRRSHGCIRLSRGLSQQVWDFTARRTPVRVV